MQIAYCIAIGEEFTMRYAIYYTPEKDDPLTRVAARWLGRDPFTGETTPAPAVEPLSAAEVAFHTAAARRYGFHATLGAPFHLAEGRSEGELLSAFSSFAVRQAPFTVPRVELHRLDGFFAIVPASPEPALDALAASVVTTFEPFRAPLGPAEIERRNPDQLTPAQLKNLHQWGYPYVFDEFRFHMTLTGRVQGGEARRVEQAIDRFFGPLLLEPLEIASIALFAEPEPGAPFRVRSLHELGSRRERKTA